MRCWGRWKGETNMIRKVDMYQCVCDGCGKHILTILMAMLLGPMKIMQQSQLMKMVGSILKGKIIVQIAMCMMKNQTSTY